MACDLVQMCRCGHSQDAHVRLGETVRCNAPGVTDKPCGCRTWRPREALFLCSRATPRTMKGADRAG